MEKCLKLGNSKSLMKWFVLLIIIALIITFSSCKKDCDCPEQDNYPSLKVTNDLEDDWRSITAVSLVGYKFDKLDIAPFGDSQLFILDEGMSGGYGNINVTVNYIRYTGVSASRSLKVDFFDGETTSITLTGCDDAEGCSGIYLDQDDYI